VSVVFVVALAVLVMVLLVLLALLLRKTVRVRRRRRRGDPRRRLLAAWQESLDFLVEAGLPEPSAMTSAEVVRATDERFGTEPAEQVRFLGDAANVAIFSPSSWVGPEQADAAWRAEAALSRSVRRRLDWRRRIGTRLRYHRVRRIAPLVGPTSWAATARTRSRSAGSRTSGRGGKHVRRRVHR
jgi:hypothetical protein